MEHADLFEKLELSYNKFGNSSTWKVNNIEFQNKVLEILCRWWNDFECKIFPGPQPVSIERKHFDLIKQNEYWVCEKTDGVRFIFLAVKINDIPFCLCINRRRDIYLLNFELEDSVFEGTIFDGELVFDNDKNAYKYLVYDSTRISGKDITKQKHSERLRETLSVIEYIKYDEDSSFEIHFKFFAPLNQIEAYLSNNLITLTHATDGLIFTPENEEIKSGTHFTMFKWKECSNNTIDFSIIYNDKTTNFTCWLSSNKRRLQMKNIHLCFDQSNKNIHSIIREFQKKDNIRNCIIECLYISENEWKPIKYRDDKIHPNNMLTYQKTLLNIRENIKSHEFVDLFKI